MTDNIFDFSDLSDLPEDLKGKLTSPGGVNPNIDVVAKIVEAAAVAGINALSITQIAAVSFRMGNSAISQQSMRNALNAAVKFGRLAKPTRQTYAVPSSAMDVAEAVADSTDLTDPLA